jgi:Ca2+-binding RTX toxin-like protein
MVALVNIGVMSTPSNGHDLEPANLAASITYVTGATPGTEAGSIGTVHVGRDGIAPGSQLGWHDPLSGNAATIQGLSNVLVDLADGFSVSWNHNGSIVTRTLDAADFAGITDLAQLANKIDAIDPTALDGRIDSNGNLQVTALFPRSLTAISLTTSVGLPQENTTVDITGVTDANADNVDAFSLSINGVPLDTASLDLSSVTNRAELAAALDALPGIQVTESADNGGTIKITAETQGPKTFTDISLADLTANPAVVSFGASSLAALDAAVAAAESFSLKLNGVALDLSGLDFSQIDTAAQLAAALDAAPDISAMLSGSTITIVSDAVGAGNAFSDLALTDNEGSPAAYATVMITGVDARAAETVAFTLSLDGVPVDLAPVDFSAVTDGASLAAQLDKIAGIDVAYSAANGGTLTITASTIGPAVFSDVSLARFNSIRGTEAAEFLPAGNLDAWIMGLGGDDSLFGSAGDDRLDGGEGNDTLQGNSGFDELNGGGGDDTIYGGYRDAIDGGDGNDRIYLLDAQPASLSGGAGDDTVLLLFSLVDPVPDGAGIERYEIAGSNVHADFSQFSTGVTVAFNGYFDSSVSGSRHDDRILGGAGNDTAYGGSGNDTFSPGGDVDYFDGGDDTDTLVLSGLRQQFRVDLLGNGDIAVTDLRVSGAVTTVRAVETFTFTDRTIDVASILNDPPVGDVIVSGSAVEDQVLSVDASSLADQDGIGVLHYQWQRDSGHGFQDVGADEATYSLGDADAGAAIRVLVRYVDQNGNADVVASATTGPVAGINDVPVMTVPDGGDLILPENETAVAHLAATDPDNASLIWSIAALFRVDAGGALSFITAPDFEHPVDLDHDNVYRVQVRVSDGSLADEQALVITLTNVNEAPVLTGVAAAATYPGGAPLALAPRAAVADQDGDIVSARIHIAGSFAGSGDLLAVDTTGTTIAAAFDDASHTLVLSGADTAAHYSQVLASLTFQSGSDPGNDGANPQRTIEWEVSDGTTSAVASTIVSVETHLVGTPGDDSFTALAGTERIDAGGGIDTITFGFALTDATVTYSANQVIIDSASSHTVLTGFERFVFTDGTVNNRDGDPLVDDLFYYAQNRDVWRAGVDADAHYHAIGWHEGRDPSAFFSTSTYLAINSDVKAAGIDPLAHWHAAGWQEGRLPSLAFDAANYLQLNPDVAAAGVYPLWHFLAIGAGEGRGPVAPTRLPAANGFDVVYYLQQNSDVAAAGVDPFWHFQTVGWKEDRDPNALFDVSGYLSAYADVKQAGINPLDHYNVAGWHEGRDPSVDFDTSAYLAANSDVKAAEVNPLVHFLRAGLDEGRSAQADGIWG